MSADAKLIFLTHPEVTIDPAIPVPRWSLSPLGRQRVELFARSPLLGAVGEIFSSDEQKALDAAEILARHINARLWVDPALGENDRSSTGYLPPPQFEAMANRFFAEPTISVEGWERAIDAQRRVIDAVQRADSLAASDRDLLIIAHGGVGALLLAHVSGQSISRGLDQPAAGGGNFLVLARGSLRLIEGWQSIPRP